MQHKTPDGATKVNSKSSESLHTSKLHILPLPAKLVSDQIPEDTSARSEETANAIECKKRTHEDPTLHSLQDIASLGGVSKTPPKSSVKTPPRSISDERVGVATIPPGSDFQEISSAVPIHKPASVYIPHSSHTKVVTKEEGTDSLSLLGHNVNAEHSAVVSSTEQESHGPQQGTTDFYVSYSNPVPVETDSDSGIQPVPGNSGVGATKKVPNGLDHQHAEPSVKQTLPAEDSATVGVEGLSTSTLTHAERGPAAARQGTTEFYVSYSNPTELGSDDSTEATEGLSYAGPAHAEVTHPQALVEWNPISSEKQVTPAPDTETGGEAQREQASSSSVPFEMKDKN